MSHARLPLAALRLLLPIVCLVPAPASFAEDYVHVVRPGQTLIGIGKDLLRRPRDWAILQRINGVMDPFHILPGRHLRIPEQLLRSVQGAVEVVYLRGDVRAGERVLRTGDKLDPGVMLAVEGAAAATLRFADGTEMLVDGPTRLGLEQVARQLGSGRYRYRLQLDQGRIETAVPEADGQRRELDVRSRGAILGVRGTEFRYVTQDDGVRAEVTRGKVGLRADGEAALGTGRAAGQKPGRPGEALVAAGYGLRWQEQGAGDRVPEALLPPPGLNQLPEVYTRPDLVVPVTEVVGAVAYRFVLSQDAAGRRPVAQIQSTTPVGRFSGLPDGDYFLRVRAVAPSGMEGLDAGRALRLAAHPEPPFPQSPVSRSQGESTRFRWTRAPEAVAYRFQIAAVTGQDDPNPAWREQELPAGADGPPGELSLPLAPGDYRWRIASRNGDGRLGPDSDVRTLRVLGPGGGLLQSGDQEADGQLHFSWSDQTVPEYEFQLARDGAFQDVVFQTTVKRPEVALPDPPAGTYYVRFRGRDPDGFLGTYSQAQRVDVADRSNPPWWLLVLLIPLL